MTSVGELLTREHRRLDELFGRFLAASSAGDVPRAREAARDFDDELRRHTRLEEERVLPAVSGDTLAARPEESDSERRARELRLEHVQIREVSGMIRRVLEERDDVEAARRLAPNLAKRWDAHTTREEDELFPSLAE